MKAEYDLYKTILTQDRDSLVSRLEIASEQSKPGRVLDCSHPFSAWYKCYQAQFARLLLRAAGTSGIAQVVADVQVAFQARHYPANIDTWVDPQARSA